MQAEAKTFPSDDSRFGLFFDYLCTQSWRKEPAVVYYEDVMRHPSATQAKVWCGMRGVLFAALAKEAAGTLIVPVAVGTLKKFGAGNGRADKADMTRTAMNAWPDVNWGGPPKKALHDIADALWLAEFGVKEWGSREGA